MRFRMNIYSQLKNINNDNKITNINVKNNNLLHIMNDYDVIKINQRKNNGYYNKIIGIK